MPKYAVVFYQESNEFSLVEKSTIVGSVKLNSKVQVSYDGKMFSVVVKATGSDYAKLERKLTSLIKVHSTIVKPRNRIEQRIY
jgi:hypothetical protein